MRMTDPAQLADALRIPFSDQQLEAITAPLEPAVVIAGAGSGKTTVMAARVVWLVGSGQVRPEQVLGLTFTRKAAGELGARVRRALHQAGVLADDVEAGEELILTYDAFAGRLVAEHGLRLGLEGDARMVTGAARYRLAARVVADTPGLDQLSRLRPASVTQRLLELSSELRSHLVDPLDLADHAVAFEASLERAPRNPRGQVYAAVQTARAAMAERLELATLVVRYEELKARLGYVEFADQMAAAARLATEVPAVPEALRSEFAVVLLDEYQDTSAAQATLLRGLFSGQDATRGRGHPVTAVGDPCQAIYGWRGAAASNILDFAHHFPGPDGAPATGYALTVNRRSGQRVLDAANHLAATVRADPALTAHGLDLDLVAPPGTPEGRVETASFVTWPEEVEALADRIAALHETGAVAAWSDVAVLARRNAQVADVYAELALRDIPAEIVGLGGLLELPAVADVVATLTLLDDATANPALVRLLTSPRWAIGIPDLALLGRRARELADARAGRGGATAVPPGEETSLDALVGTDPAAVPSLLEAVTDPGPLAYHGDARRRFAVFATELGQLRRHAGDAVTELVQRVIAVLGLTVELEVVEPGGRAPLATFVQAVADYTDIDADASLAGLLAWLEAEREYGTGLEQAVVSTADSVKVLTVHKAKGLEWDVVFVPALAAKVFPTDRVTGNWLRSGSTLPYPLRGDATAIPQLGHVDHPSMAAFAESLSGQQRLGEDRLAYVAVTRARQLLVASTHTWAPGLATPREPSDYFTLLAEHAQDARVAGDVPDENPLLGRDATAAWPAVGATEAFWTRREAAAGVRAAREQHAAADGYPEHGGLSLDEAELVAAWRRRSDVLVAAEQQAARERNGARLPDYLSVTGLGRLARDPVRFADELRRPMPRLVSEAQRWGIGFHEWLEQRFRSQAPLLDGDDTEVAGADFEQLRAGFENGPYASLVPEAIETPFTLVLAGRLVRGRIDAVFSGPDGRPQVVDWKTGDARRSDPLQLACYRLAWAELHGLPVDGVDAVFYDLHTAEVVRPPRLPDRASLEALLERLPGSVSLSP
ncbi:UvrD-helicase domain-containing protein [Propionicimonas sp.]|uniref:UvrD-helicase domain-containing protein n=1 Tax=Propionicimonas sp. TaxID=1955623 RepID=UPI0039E47D60